MKRIATIGFSKKSLQEFVELLKKGNVTCLVDTRLNNTSQLAGFAKKKDLKYILEEFLNIKYVHEVDLAPTEDILSDFKNKKITWDDYKNKYTELLNRRDIQKRVKNIMGENETICFLCSEHKPDQCHRSVLADYFKKYEKDIDILHLI